MPMFCFWCEPGNIPKHLNEKGYVWVHLDCLMALSNFVDDLKAVREILEGKRDNDTVESFLIRMGKFDENTKKMMELVK